MGTSFRPGQTVKWKWGRSYGHGVVERKYERTVNRKIGGKEIKRKGSKDNPAYYVRVESGSGVLKLGSELYPG